MQCLLPGESKSFIYSYFSTKYWKYYKAQYDIDNEVIEAPQKLSMSEFLMVASNYIIR